MHFSDTIFALSSAMGKAGIAVIRISGLHANSLFGTLIMQPPAPPKQAQLAQFHDPERSEIVDFGLYIYFAAPKSFTGEDCIELHLHGGLATIQSILTILGKIPNFRPAEPGEFTRRGFLNGKFDLTQAESTIDLIDAETDHQRRAALAHTRGALHQLYEGWWRHLTELRAYAEVCLDFPDEELPEDLETHILAECLRLTGEIRQHHDTTPQGERLRLGIKIAIIGPSNAGKSSLLNYLTQTQSAIISPIAGTTRDSLEHHVDIAGYPVKLVDTAGLQDTDDPIEQEGIRRARTHAEIADLVMIMFDGNQPISAYQEFLSIAQNQPYILVINKIDQEFNCNNGIILSKFDPNNTVSISLTHAIGLEKFQNLLHHHLQQLAGNSHAPIIMHARYQHALHTTLKALHNVTQMVHIAQNTQQNPDLVLIAEELRIGLNSIAGIIGRVDVEDLLKIIFSRFCIGK